MIRKLLPWFVVILVIALAGSAFSQTEDEIIAKYLKKTEKKHNPKVGFVGLTGAYGKLPNETDYLKFRNYYNNNIVPGNPIDGIWRSKQFGLEMGMMFARQFSFKVGFEYWLKMGSEVTGDYTLAVEPLGVQSDFTINSEVQVYGFSAGFDYYFLNPPSNKGVVNALSVRLGANGGLYMAKWEIWSGASAFNLSLENFEQASDPYTGSAPTFSVWLGADYPIQFFGLLLGAEVDYRYLNFNKLHAYNDLGEELYVTYSADSADRVKLDFSGLRGKVVLKRYFTW
jgi:hypothetical protein